jgi:hypothetical protein
VCKSSRKCCQKSGSIDEWLSVEQRFRIVFYLREAAVSSKVTLGVSRGLLEREALLTHQKLDKYRTSG